MPLPPGIRAVAFDAVGTLIAPHPPAAEAYAAVAQQFGVSLDVATIRGRFLAALERQDRLDSGAAGWRTTESRERDRWRQIVGECLLEIADPQAPFEMLWDHFARPESWHVYADVAPTWERLAAKGVTIVIASNFDSRLDGLTPALAPLGLATKTFVSASLGFRKPAEGFFATIERELDCRPHELLMIGDDEQNDYLAARRRGWHAALVDRSSRRAGPHVLASLDEILK